MDNYFYDLPEELQDLIFSKLFLPDLMVATGKFISIPISKEEWDNAYSDIESEWSEVDEKEEWDMESNAKGISYLET